MPVKKVQSSKFKVQSEQSSRLRAKKVATKSVIEKKVATLRISGLSVPVYSLAGRALGTLALPKEIFGKEVNQKLLAQALRVYMTNQKVLPGNTKTRGEVVGSTAKIFRQKGTGRARHGAIRAPIFVGGGIAFGPKPRNLRLDLPKKMRKAALHSALSSKAKDQGIMGLSGIEKASGKTKEFVELLKKINSKQGSALIVTDEKTDNVVRAVRNIPNVHVLSANLINAYEILKHEMLFITKEAVESLRKMPKKEQE